MSIIQSEIELYEEVHSLENYADISPGERYLSIFLENAPVLPNPEGKWPTTVLDAGCASGKAGLALSKHDYSVTLADITESGLIEEAQSLPFKKVNLWKSIPLQVGNLWGGKFDYVICCDVLEHLPTQFTMLSIEHMLEVAKKGLFLTVSTQPDYFGTWVGRPLHQTIQPFEWWRDSIRELGTVIDARDLINSAIFYVSN